MALTPSQMVPLGTPLPLAALQQALAGGDARPVSGEPFADPVADRPLLVLFLCAHCPFVKHVEAEIGRLVRDHPALQLLAIASNSTITHPQDGPAGLAAQAAAQGWRFPYLFDGSQRLARAFQAACTPDPFLYAWQSGQHRLVYRGQFDGSRPGADQPCDGADIRAAIAAVLAGRAVNPEQRPAIGCNIKWRPGEEPEWAR
ncbi:MAG: thioredoxin family protein [Chitinophagaceae bacterium]|nr:thioredoxin family protein [Chitinophagaceae bacterium]